MVTKFVLMMRTFKVYFLATFEYATQCYYLSPRGNSSMLLCYCYCWPGWESSGVGQGQAGSGRVGQAPELLRHLRTEMDALPSGPQCPFAT